MNHINNHKSENTVPRLFTETSVQYKLLVTQKVRGQVFGCFGLMEAIQVMSDFGTSQRDLPHVLTQVLFFCISTTRTVSVFMV